MQYLAPLVQTALWVALAAAVLWRFHKPLHSLLTALAKRIDTGSSVKAGPFEISEQVRPQTQEDQSKRISAETRELLSISNPPPSSGVTAASTHELITTAQFFVAEDLALRALQAEFGEVLSRQVVVGTDLKVDALFMQGSELNLVEVKFLPSAVRLGDVVRQLIHRVEHGVATDKKLRHIRPNLIIVLVLNSAERLNSMRQELERFAEDSPLQVSFRTYLIEELQSRFGPP